MKMCEAFFSNGVDCKLIAPLRSLDPLIDEKDPFQYYGIKNKFPLTFLPSIDTLYTQNIPFIGKFLFWLQQRSFGSKVKKYLRLKEGIIYTRDQFILNSFINSDFKLYWEAHNFPRVIESNFYKKILNRIDGLIVITGGLKDKFASYYKGEILVAPDAVDPEEFNISLTKPEARQKTNLPLNKKIALYVGQLYEWKGASVIIESLKYLSENELIVIIGGSPEDILKYKNSIPRNYKDNIIFIGQINHKLVPLYLQSADCLLLTGKKGEAISELYTSPLKLFEYMFSQRPIVAQNLPSFREVLNDHNSIIVNTDDPEAFADGVHKAFSDDTELNKIIEKAYDDVRDNTWQNRAKIIADYIRKNV